MMRFSCFLPSFRRPVSLMTAAGATIAIASLLLLPAQKAVRAQANTPRPFPTASGSSVSYSNGGGTFTEQYWVAQTSNANDNNAGTSSAQPLRTVTKAVQLAVADKNAGRSVCVNVGDGTYREQVTIPAPPAGSWAAGNNDGARLTIRAVNAGRTILSGSDSAYPSGGAWNQGWTKLTDGTGRWRHAWPYRWGLSPTGRYYEGGPVLDTHPLAQRRELVFVNGMALKQVGSTSAAPPANMPLGSFHVNVDAGTEQLATGTVYVRPPSGVTTLNDDPATTAQEVRVEVAARPSALIINKRARFSIEDLVFQHTTQYQDDTNNAGLFIDGSTNFLIQNCATRWNNKLGIRVGDATFTGSADITLRGVDASDNGFAGMRVARTFNLLAEDCETSRNNFRGLWADWLNGAAPCAFKIQSTRTTTWRRHIAVNNYARGMWWDTDNTNILAESCYMRGNYMSGLFVEYSQGPTLISRCIVRDTQDSPDITTLNEGGLMISTSQDVRLESNIVYNNAQRQFRIWNTAQRGDGSNFTTGNQLVLDPRRFTFFHNVFLGSGDQDALAFPPNDAQYGFIYDTMDSGPNCFWTWNGSASNPDIFSVLSNATAVRTARSFSQWQAYSGQEANSVLAPPSFFNASADDFRLNTGSPVAGWNLPTAPLD